MKEKKLFDTITDVSEDLIEEAAAVKFRAARGWRRWAAVAACAVLIAGAVALIPGDRNSGGALMAVNYPQAFAFDDYDTWRAILDANPVEEDFLAAINAFSYETTAAIFADTGENINYSPLSLYYALALAASGAEGETARELLDLLGVADASELSVQCGYYYRRLYRDNAIGKLKIANSLWIDEEMGNEAVDFREDFMQNAAENFYASVHTVDFSSVETGELMARWVSDNTNGTLSPEFAVDTQQLLSILNTIYFYDQWTDRFDKGKTADGTFHLSDGSEVQCDFMNSHYGSAGFARGDGFTRASLGLKNSGRMVFILPDEGVSPYELLSSPERMREAFEGGEKGHGEVVWQVPKFDFGSELDLADAVNALGVSAAFTQEADFSGITAHVAFISSIRQETHIAIDENGVEASAFTEISYATAALPEGRAEMILDRPFIYGIVANNGSLLFVGVCEDPTAA